MTADKTVIQAGAMRRLMLHPLRNWDERLTLYYDETNNIRRLTLSEVGLNVPDNKTFVLAGIGLRAGQALPGIDDLRSAIRLQTNAPELKARHIAEGSFEAMLASQHLHTYLSWLLDRGLLVHYFGMNVLFWSLIDIIDSIQGRDPVVAMHSMQLKNELYDVVSRDPQQFLLLLHGFTYPNVDRSAVRRFMTAVVAFLERQAPRNRNPAAALLKDRLRNAVGLDELVFLHDNEKGELIPDFSVQFLNGVYVFKNAMHVFDQEKFVQRALTKTEVWEGDKRLDYRFADSRAEVGIQLSDVIAHLFGKYFTFLQEQSLPELLAKKSALSPLQRSNLALLRELIDRSDAVSEGFCHTLMPMDTNDKNNSFLHDVPAPDYIAKFRQ